MLAMGRLSRRGRAVWIAALAGALLIVFSASALAASPSADDRRVEQGVRSEAPDASKVEESYVRLHDPLPDSAAEHPRSCDSIGYLRFRNAGGPGKAKRADAVVVNIPGFLGGAGSFDQLARNTVRSAAARGEDVEFWALDRRANCLEDHRGVNASARERDPKVAFDYYFGGRKVNGRAFDGFVSREDAAFLEDFGLDRTVRDWYSIVTRELPGQERRERKLICGGHSLGGPLTAAFAGWDFDGDPDTRRDAGYKQCAGFVGLDTTFSITGGAGAPSGAGILTGLIAQSGAAPYIDAPPLTPRTIQIVPITGAASYERPEAESPINRLIPRTPEFDLTLRLLYSRDAASFATGQPSIRDFRLTNQAVLGGIFDDNSAGISILRSSVGFLAGGPLVDKDFPAPDGTLALPEQPRGPLYRWQTYDRVGRNGKPVPPNDSGQPYTSRESEVTDIEQFARGSFEAPADFTEQYFPTRIFTDVAAAQAGDRSGDLSNLRYDGVSKRPGLLIQAGDSDDNSGEDSGPPEQGEPPNEMPDSREVILPGYNHLDVVTAARKQNDGRPEGSSTSLVDFACDVVLGCERGGSGGDRGRGFTRGSPPVRR